MNDLTKRAVDHDRRETNTSEWAAIVGTSAFIGLCLIEAIYQMAALLMRGVQ